MAIYRNISMTFWTDAKVDDDFTPEDKYFYLYLLTNPHTNICGCFEISMKQMCRETGYNEDTVLRLLDRMEHQHGVVRYSTATKEVLIVNWHKYNWTKSEKMLSGVLDVAKYIKNPDFKLYVFETLASYGLKTDTLSIGYTKGMETSVSVSVSDTVSVSVSEEESVQEEKKEVNRATASRFKPPTVEEVADYCRERDNHVDPQRFVDHYTSNGWKVGKNPMKDWKAAVRTWEKNSEGGNNRGHPESLGTGTRGADRSAAWGIKSIID